MKSENSMHVKFSARQAGDPCRRLTYWNTLASERMGKHACISAPDIGLDARYSGYQCGAIGVHLIEADEHVIERSHSHIRCDARASVFVNLLLSGSSFHYRGGSATALQARDMLIHDTSHPYLHAFPARKQLLIFDIPTALFASRFARPDQARLLHRETRSAAGDTAARHLAGYALAGPLATHAVDNRSEGGILSALEWLLDPPTKATSSRAAQLLMLAKAYIDANLCNEALNRDQVSEHVGVSTRHLERVFGETGESVAQHIQARRLERALEDVLAGAARGGIGDIAFRYGFGSHAHFTRVFRARYHLTPSQVRDGAVAT
ncbi:helix-turn-helix domain-containing protein [Caballeronia sp. GAFFF1]|uniref:helix-turn-helix domain-containing protein n=1 Tax=Caballeronia sp. GAFFF1 TaxID=2921779 RepID=UPI0020289A6B|nr:helix-turn-helix domain-containing protein [Caballeronia sp. GAFFF1]